MGLERYSVELFWAYRAFPLDIDIFLDACSNQDSYAIRLESSYSVRKVL